VSTRDTNRAVVKLTGNWTLRTGFPRPDELLEKLFPTNAANDNGDAQEDAVPFGVSFDCSSLGRFDSCLPAFLLAVERGGAARKTVFDVGTLPSGVAKILALASSRPAHADTTAAASGAARPEETGDSFPIRRVAGETLFFRLGSWGMTSVHSWGKALDFIGQTAIAFGKLLRGQARCRFRECWFFVQTSGVDAFPIVGLISFLTGLILAYVGVLQMRQVGAIVYVPGGVAISMMREMGVLMASIVLCGRTATAYAAQLGSMQVSEEMSAYRSMGVSPVEYLVLPRMIALVFMLPFLTLYANFAGIVGGLVVTTSMGITLEQSYNRMALIMTVPSFTSGLIKAALFAVLIGWAGCFRGMVCGKSSQAVGDAATSAAVLGITLVIIADALFSVFFNVIDFF
jgi:phospholipid/cholesterol/gamma-HCH transport system permease protein